jgi:hypothetical protein
MPTLPRLRRARSLFPFATSRKPRLFKIGLMFFPTVENVFEVRLFFENGLGFVGVVPKIRLRGDLVQFREALLLGIDVKAASATVRAALRGG